MPYRDTYRVAHCVTFHERLCSLQVVSRDLDPTDELLIIGCDGLWDSMTPADAWRVVQVRAIVRAKYARECKCGVPMLARWSHLFAVLGVQSSPLATEYAPHAALRWKMRVCARRTARWS